MRKTAVIAACCVLLVFLFGCQSDRREPRARTLEGSVRSEVLEHKGSALGINQLPVWVETYISTGITGLEKLADYEGSYCFVGETAGTNLEGVKAWGANFDAQQEIARYVSARVESVFSGAATGSLDSEYGTYFENVVRASADAQFSGVRKINDWWVKLRIYDPDNKKAYTDEYRAYVLYTIPQDMMNRQVLDIIDTTRAASAGALSDVQNNSIDRVRALIESSGF